ncbi:MAG: sensor histidine kinase N-terminal domain-containing protein [Acidobacteriia bacterium]|nr:sensor histidine kinase N-terminal domain-containing protein [Terriglobia bacterium]
MMRSIRVRLLVWTVCGMAILLAVFAVAVYEVICRSLLAGYDEVLISTARTIRGFVEQNKAEIKVEIDEHQVPEFNRSYRPDYFQLWREDGRTLARSQSITAAELARIEGPLDTPVFQPIRLPDGRTGRAVGFSFVPKVDEDTHEPIPPRKVTLVVARETTALDAEIRYLRWLLATATGGTIILALVVGAVVVRQGLRPLDALASQIAAIQYDDLSAQVPVDGIPAEMAAVVKRLNDLLRRLEEAFRRERAFSADVAHELRTPLAGMRCTLEVALTRPRAGIDYRQAIEECLDIIRRTQKMVDNLLALARLEDGKTMLHPESVRLAELIEHAWRPLCDGVRARGITIESRVPDHLACMADRESLRMILTSLFENAAEYANDGGHIEVAGAQAGDSAEVSIANTGCRLSEEDTRHVFDRFWRSDAARTNTGIHCGLGLALVQRATTSLRGTVSASAANGTFTVRLKFPAAA